jgi:hypothetical protein
VAEHADYPEQLLGRTAGGTVYVQDKGLRSKVFELCFEELAQSDRDTALAFFDTVKKALKTFEYRDRAGNVHSVRWVNEFLLHAGPGERYAGKIRLQQQ